MYAHIWPTNRKAVFRAMFASMVNAEGICSRAQNKHESQSMAHANLSQHKGKWKRMKNMSKEEEENLGV